MSSASILAAMYHFTEHKSSTILHGRTQFNNIQTRYWLGRWFLFQISEDKSENLEEKIKKLRELLKE
jgi:hypothetical protein